MKASKLLSLVAAGSFLAMAGIASAQEPVKLSETQMDAVTAGGLVAGQGFAFAGQSVALAAGLFNAATLTTDTANVTALPPVVLPPAEVFIYVTATSTSHAEAAAL